MVNIYLNHDHQSPFLSIPNSDVERLSNRPFRWLRYVMFSICGARGDLFHTSDPSDDPVDYDTSLANLPDVIYYRTSGDCIFVDYKGLSDRITSTDQTIGREGFRRAVRHRDGSCVITGEDAGHCDAVHLIPMSKGDEYIAKVVEDRSPLYDPPPSISGINDSQNGMLVTKNLHSRAGKGLVALLNTPNYGLEPTDIKRVNVGPARTDYITLQQLKVPEEASSDEFATLVIQAAELQPSITRLSAALSFGAHIDVQFRGPSPLRPPPALILDYVYGIAAYKRWRGRQSGVHAVMEEYRDANYKDIPPLPRLPDDDTDDTSVGSGQQDDSDRSYHNSDNCLQEEDDAHGPDYPPRTPRQRIPYMSLRMGDEMAAIMDELNLVLMSHRGITPQEAAMRREKRMAEVEAKAQEASRGRVVEWMRATAAGGP